jgi:uncharacterized membrane protein YphA (DoxX/SURF4 family)
MHSKDPFPPLAEIIMEIGVTLAVFLGVATALAAAVAWFGHA